MNDENEIASAAAGSEASTGQAGSASTENEAAAITPEKENELTGALSSTLDSLNQSIELMEAIVRKLEAGEADWEESVRMLAEANELAVESSQKLDRVVQDVVYGSDEGESSDQETIPGL